MTRVIEAIYCDGVLQPVESLELPDQQRVRLTIEPINTPSDEERRAAVQKLFEEIDEMDFRLTGPLPTREELHERR